MKKLDKPSFADPFTIHNIPPQTTQPTHNMITYYDSSEDITITRSNAFEVLEQHGIPTEEFEEFLEDVGYADTYEAQSVLNWLGY